MDETYDITYDGALVGRAKMDKQGLYYAFSCRCRLPDQELYRIHVICGGNREDLGICVPMGDTFGMDKRIPVKRLGEGSPSFLLLPKDWKPTEPIIAREPEPEVIEEPPVEEEIRPEKCEEECFIPVCEDEPFEHLDKLEDARMEIRDDTIGMIIPADTDVWIDD